VSSAPHDLPRISSDRGALGRYRGRSAVAVAFALTRSRDDAACAQVAAEISRLAQSDREGERQLAARMLGEAEISTRGGPIRSARTARGSRPDVVNRGVAAFRLPTTRSFSQTCRPFDNRRRPARH